MSDKKRILIVEDEPITALDEQEILNRLGYEVIGIAFTGELALSEVERQRPDLVLMDIMLIGFIDGMQAAEIIRRDYGIPVVFVSALTGNARPPAAIRYVTKPYNEEKLRTAIEEALSEARQDLP